MPFRVTLAWLALLDNDGSERSRPASACLGGKTHSGDMAFMPPSLEPLEVFPYAEPAGNRSS